MVALWAWVWLVTVTIRFLVNDRRVAHLAWVVLLVVHGPLVLPLAPPWVVLLVVPWEVPLALPVKLHLAPLSPPPRVGPLPNGNAWVLGVSAL